MIDFAQYKLDFGVIVKISMGVDSDGEQIGEYQLKPERSLYGLKQASMNWDENLKNDWRSVIYLNHQ